MMSLRWHALNATTKFGGRPITFVVLVILILAPLAFNPGYFNHDELQWLSFADVPTLHQIPWSGWLDFHIFQYRPLTFNFWLLLSHYFGYQPVLMHIVRAAFALVIALMLRVVLLRFGAGSRHASVAICVYLLLPCVVYTNAWIGTFADAFCLLSVLCALVWVCRERKPDASTIELVHDAILVAVLTAIALMSKETAILFPFALLLCATPRQNRGLLTAFVASSFVVAIYLYLRLDVILFGSPGSNAYAWSLANIPKRLAEYAAFPFLPDQFEVVGSLVHKHILLASCGVVLLLVAVAQTGWRRFSIFVVGWGIALGPILILAHSAPHYAYFADTFIAGFVAVNWRKFKLMGRLIVTLLVTIACFHGYLEIKEFRHIGRIQQRLYSALPQLLNRNDGAPIAIQAQEPEDAFVLQRLLFDVPSYKRIEFGDRVIVVPYGNKPATPTYLMTTNGRLLEFPLQSPARN